MRSSFLALVFLLNWMFLSVLDLKQINDDDEQEGDDNNDEIMAAIRIIDLQFWLYTTFCI